MNWLVVAVIVAIATLALLLARGMYLIGTGSEAELEARDRMDGTTATTGWMTLDRLRTGDVPIVSTIEEKLGINEEEEDDE